MSERKESAGTAKKTDKADDGAKKAAAGKAKAKERAEAREPAKPREKAPAGPAPDARLQNYYRDTVVPDLMQKFGYKTAMQVPRIEKITLNMGVGETTSDRKILDHAMSDMSKIAGQKPVTTLARKSIATFKVRKDYPVGCMVTLRGKRMYEFLDRLVTVAMPRIRDFRGISGRAFDGRGNYSLGVKEQIIFPEIEYDKIDALRGMNISITTSAKSDDEARALLAAFRFPFKSN
jgi:large subunit ribosomal protein L5